MVYDTNPEVRLVVARRIDPSELKLLLLDDDWRVHFAACAQANIDDLLPLLDDEY